MPKIVRILLGVVAVVVLLVAVGVGFVALKSNGRITATIDVPLVSLQIPSDPAAIERGKHRVTAVLACAACHAADLGGGAFFDAPPMGTLSAANLTSGRGGIGGEYAAADWDRAIRHGVGKDGKPLLWMPSEAYEHLTNAEIAEVIAWLQTLPPVNRELAPKNLGPITRMILATGQPVVAAEVIDHAAVGSRIGSSGATGRHLVNLGGCVSCHGANLSGGTVPGTDPSWPPAGNLTPHPDGLGRYDATSFAVAMRQGRKPDGSAIDPGVMPWASYAHMTDEELAAIWEYLNTLEPREQPR